VAPAELTVALMLATRRNITVEAERMKQGLWPEYLSHRLAGTTLGIFGYGVIGALVARAGAGLGMRILAWGRSGSRQRAEADGYEFAAGKQEFFERADVLSLHLRMGAGAEPAVTAEDLARMKPTALLVNTARADLIAPGALVDALNAGRPGFAAVDVYEDEPVTGGNHPLLKMPNVVCMPHLGWADRDTFELYFGETFEQVQAYCAGAPVRLLNPDVSGRMRALQD
jgi:D-3-phosphoglycerate dehydrogenase